MNNSILTLVTFLPAIGALALMLMPRNDRRFALGCARHFHRNICRVSFSPDVLRLRRVRLPV